MLLLKSLIQKDISRIKSSGDLNYLRFIKAFQVDSKADIKVDNVARFYWQHEQDHWSISGGDFPNLAPPFETFWMEYRMPGVLTAQGVTKKRPDVKGLYVGALFRSEVYSDDFTDSHETDCRWELIADVFMYHKRLGKGVVYLGVIQMGITEDGRLGKWNGDYKIAAGVDGGVMESTRAKFGDIPKEQLVDMVWQSANPFLLAISFLHCKNVEMIKQSNAQTRKKKTKSPLVRYYTLKIEPMKKVLKKEGQLESTGIKHALHICRGHFKDYREKGLFGKYKDIFWWDSQVRGSRAEGEVIKTYEIAS